MIKCQNVCDNYAVYVDSFGEYICNECKDKELNDDRYIREDEDFTELDWDKYPVDGYTT